MLIDLSAQNIGNAQHFIFGIVAVFVVGIDTGQASMPHQKEMISLGAGHYRHFTFIEMNLFHQAGAPSWVRATRTADAFIVIAMTLSAASSMLVRA